MGDVQRLDWWKYPVKCGHGHPWGPGRVIVSWVVCQCALDGGEGHLRVSCRTDGCPSVWYQPPHRPGAEVTGRRSPAYRLLIA
jgi:hypothetical protein